MNQILWKLEQDKVINTQIWKFKDFINKKFNLNLLNYKDLHGFSVKEKESFWREILEYFNVAYTGETTPALLDDSFKSYSWFPEVKLNFAKNLLKAGRADDVAINFVHENALNNLKITFKELRENVTDLGHELNTFMNKGDVLAAYMPNIPETCIAMLATSSFGGIFTSTSCDFGIEGVLDRFGQSKPKVLVSAIGYEYGGKYFDLTAKIKAIEESIPSIEKIYIVDFLGRGVDLGEFKKAELLSDVFLKKNEKELNFVDLEFSHPLYIMYSSGTTGKPKCIVHSQGGTLLQHIKEHTLHCDVTRDKSLFFFTTCGWMMWNWLVSGIYTGATVVLFEGSPAHPSPQYFFEMINREKINIFGTSPKFLKALEDTDTKFGEYPSLETILSTGSPLLPEQYDYVYNHIKKDVLLGSISGGTDIVSCFMLASPILPVYRGEIQCSGLGMDVQCLDDHHKSVIDQEGELVCAQTFPSRPLYFLDDNNNQKLNEAYFNQNEGYWTHGDFVKITTNGGIVVLGRSDATLNPGGVRIGTAEIYRQADTLNYLEDSLCVGRPTNGDVDIILFVKMKAGLKLQNEHKKQIKDLIRKNTTPRHVPREVIEVKDIPYTRSGKKVELAVTRILAGKPVTNLTAIANAESLEEYYQYKTNE